MNFNRKIDIIKRVKSLLNIDFSDKIVLTEVGSNNYLFAPIIPAMSNAKQVLALAKDSKYGMANNIISNCKELLSDLKLGEKVTFYINEIPEDIIASADVITNSGNLRPLDMNFLANAKSEVVIPLMYEKWEFRDSDLDLEFCRQKGIRVAGTWENHPSLKIFNYVGPLAAKMIFEAGFEIYQNKIIIWSDDHFGRVVSEYLTSMGANCIVTSNNETMISEIVDTDIVYVCNYDESADYSSDEVINFDRLLQINKKFAVVHLYGEFELNNCLERFAKFYPEKNGTARTMSFTLDHVGDYPSLALLTAGFKVGECLLKSNDHKLVQRL